MWFELPYTPNTVQSFEPFAYHPWSILFDSAYPNFLTQQAHRDFWTASPVEILLQYPEETLSFFLNRLNQTLEKYPLLSSESPSLPIALGYIGYDAALSSFDLPFQPGQSRQQPRFPLSAIGIYPWIVEVDHRQKTTRVFFTPAAPFQNRTEWDAWVKHQTHATQNRLLHPHQLTGPIQTNLDFDQYQKKFMQIQEHLSAGDAYQVNFAARFWAPTTGHPYHLYQTIRQNNPAPFSAYFHTLNGSILSFSPERFLSVQDRTVRTQPIKGTIARAPDPALDRIQANRLQQCPKNQTENVMIVDLMRNDLAQVCQTGSIHVDPLFAVESFPGIHHLVSTVWGKLADHQTLVDLLLATFPGGSITGAPKKRTMAIIQALEPDPRTIYCGSLLLWERNGHLDSNIIIRTLLHQQDRLYFWGGGGITIASTVENEYQEIQNKIQGLERSILKNLNINNDL